MSNTPLTDSARQVAGAPRRALIIADEDAPALRQSLVAAGYEVKSAGSATGDTAVAEFAPDVAIITLGNGVSAAGAEHSSIALARRLRAEPATYALPLVFVWEADDRAMRNAALGVGADDYFPARTPTAETLARLDALFWRVEAGRRAAAAAGDRRLEIDNFMLMLDSVREDVRAGAGGTVALVYAEPRAAQTSAGNQAGSFDKAARDRTLAAAHGFLKLYLRRVDAVAFYGPTTLLAYLPRTNAVEAAASFRKLRDEFAGEAAAAEGDLVIGLASFPEDDDDVESLIERAEAAVARARSATSAAGRVATYSDTQAPSPPSTPVGAPAPINTPAFANAPAPTATSIPVPAAPTNTPAPALVALPSAAANVRPSAPDVMRAEDAATPRSEPPASRADVRPEVVGTPRPQAANNAAGGGDPAHANLPDAARRAVEAAAQERERRSRGAIMPRRLLLTISDAARMAQLNSLIRMAGYEARAAFDGQQALDLLRIERPDLLLLDYNLHGINGVETLRRLRKQGGGRLTLPVVMLLPPGNEDAGQEALELGARRVVPTAYDPADLLAHLRQAGSAE